MDRGGAYYVSTFGCRVNQADSAGVAESFDQSGWVRTTDAAQAQVVVLNTCTVTHRSDADVRKAVARLKREAPEARVMVTGCYAERAPEEAASIPGVELVVGQRFKSRLPILAQSRASPAATQPSASIVHQAVAGTPKEDLPVEPNGTVLDKTRPFIKIQDGCDAHCTYCIIPSVRGPARGADPNHIERNVRSFVDRGFFEIVLTGIHLGTYEFRFPDGRLTNLVSLVAQLLEQNPNLGRLRLSCIEPMAFPNELVSMAVKDPRLAPHFHLPLQSGSDRVLKRMVRPYKAAEYFEQMRSIRTALPHACLGTDVIVGFPGETEDDFQETVSRIAASDLNYVHVFSYSHRTGTPATRLSGSVEPRIIKKRARGLIEVSNHLHQRFLEQQVGQVLPAVVLEQKAGVTRALSENFCNLELDRAISPKTPIYARVTERVGRHLRAVLA